MTEFYAIYQQVMLYICVAALIAMVVGVFALKFSPVLEEVWSKWLHLDGLGKLVTVGMIVMFTLYGGSKSIFHFDDGLTNNGSYATNDTVHVVWIRQALVPADSTVYIDYRLSTDTNGVWTTLGTALAGALQYNGNLSNATNYDYYIWSNYVPPTPVHTNGVWCGYGERTKDGKKYLTINGRIVDHGDTIAMPNHKMKEEQE